MKEEIRLPQLIHWERQMTMQIGWKLLQLEASSHSFVMSLCWMMFVVVVVVVLSDVPWPLGPTVHENPSWMT